MILEERRDESRPFPKTVRTTEYVKNLTIKYGYDFSALGHSLMYSFLTALEEKESLEPVKELHAVENEINGLDKQIRELRAQKALLEVRKKELLSIAEQAITQYEEQQRDSRARKEERYKILKSNFGGLSIQEVDELLSLEKELKEATA